MSDDEKIVTIKDVHTQVTTLVGFMQAVSERNKFADQTHTDHEARIRMLERWRYSLPISIIMSGGATLVAAISLVRN